jgi:hypothetical protein
MFDIIGLHPLFLSFLFIDISLWMGGYLLFPESRVVLQADDPASRLATADRF